MLEEEFQQSCGCRPLPQKIRHLLDRVLKLVADYPLFWQSAVNNSTMTLL
jgi:hypothetical protein